jgi:hypothetical protein
VGVPNWSALGPGRGVFVWTGVVLAESLERRIGPPAGLRKDALGWERMLLKIHKAVLFVIQLLRCVRIYTSHLANRKMLSPALPGDLYARSENTKLVVARRTIDHNRNVCSKIFKVYANAIWPCENAVGVSDRGATTLRDFRSPDILRGSTHLIFRFFTL